MLKPIVRLTQMSLSAAAICLALASAEDAAASDPNILLVADPWCPYNCAATQDSSNNGILIDLIREAVPNITFDYKTVPWSRAIKMVLNGKAGGLVGAGRDEVPELIFPNKPMAYARHALFVRETDTWTYDGLDSLDNRRIGAISGYSYGYLKETYLDQNEHDNVQLVYGEKPFRQLLKQLETGRVDTIVAEERVLMYFLRNKPEISRPRNAGIAFKEEIYIGFYPDHPDAQKITKALDAYPLRSRGDALLGHYMN
ncbi:MAG: transporter substrate-binding domain-containing protein [Roseibium sp.]